MDAGTVFTDSGICCFKTVFVLLQLRLGFSAAMDVSSLFCTGIYKKNSHAFVSLFEVMGIMFIVIQCFSTLFTVPCVPNFVEGPVLACLLL